MKALNLIALTSCLLTLHNSVLAADSDYPRFSVSGATEYTTGTYGGDVKIEDIYVPLSGTMDFRRYSFRLTVPYLSVKAPEGTIIIGPGGEPIPGTGDLTTNSGMGDIIASATVYDVVYNRRMDFAIDLTGRVKFGTADAEKGLGTGETDYSVRGDFLKFWDQFTLIGSLGYKFRGDTADTDFSNVLTASAGGTYKFTPKLKGGLFLDYRESAIDSSNSIRELSAFLSHRVSEYWRLQAYVMTGFTDSSLDWGCGIQIKRVLPNRRDD
jgi:hypothetical protein